MAGEDQAWQGTGVGVAVGAGIGTVLGTLFGAAEHLALWIGGGAGLGVSADAAWDALRSRR